MEIVRTGSYERGLKRLRKLGATDGDIKTMEDGIATNPEVGDVVPGTHGLRKVRFGYADKGKSGGGRTIYYALIKHETIYLLMAYPKVDKEDLTADEKKLIQKLVKELTDG